MASLMEDLRAHPMPSIANLYVHQYMDYKVGVNGLPSANVIQFDMEDGNKVIVRPSGTEPKVKVYLSARAASRAEAEAALNRMEAEINERVLGK